MNSKNAITCPMAPQGRHIFSNFNDSSILFKGKKDSFELHECGYCKLIFVSNLNLSTNLALYYDLNYKSEKEVTKDHFKDLDFLNPSFQNLPKKEKASILDIGCGTGELVQKLRLKGYNAYGFDPIVNNSNSSWLFQSDIFTYEPEMKFHLIIVYQVLEHIIRPREALQRMIKWLEPKGILHIHTDMEVMRPANIIEWSYVNPPWHCCFYRHKTFLVFQKEIDVEYALDIIWMDPWSVVFKRK